MMTTITTIFINKDIKHIKQSNKVIASTYISNDDDDFYNKMT
jgi:hypothetical protein